MITLSIPIAVTFLLVAALCGGWLLGRRRVHRCVICWQPLPRVCPDARCGDTGRRAETPTTSASLAATSYIVETNSGPSRGRIIG